ncbi:MAG: hypothetical protein ACE5FI_08940 [Anaerolineales bacterium]
MYPAARLGLLQRRAWTYLRWALLFCAGFLLSSILTLIYETEIWPAASAALFIGGMTLAVRAACGGAHPGLRGFHHPLPRDGLALIDREHASLHKRAAASRWLWRVAPALPALALVAGEHPRHWLPGLLLAVSGIAPLIIIPYRRGWVAPLALLIVAGLFGWHAVDLSVQLPPGRWTTLWAGGDCNGAVVPAGGDTAWCVDDDSQWVQRYRLATGGVLEQYPIENAWQVLAADAGGAWVKTRSDKGLVYVGGGRIRFEKSFFFPIVGAIAAAGDLWFVDGIRELHVYAADYTTTQLTSLEGLLNDTAVVVTALPDGSVWIGSRSGLSHLDPERRQWETFSFRQHGFRGAVTDIAVGQDGAIWVMQREPFNALMRTGWWISILRPGADWLHINLADQIGLQAPPGRDALAVDGQGRGWFTAMSYARGEKYLGVLNADGTLAHPPTFVGRDRSAVPYRTGATRPALYGVLTDGDGGIYVYSGAGEPLRHWTP